MNIEEFNNNLKIDFDFLDKGDGAIIKLIHTKITDKRIGIQGTIKGVRKTKKHNTKENLFSKNIGTLIGMFYGILFWIISTNISLKEINWYQSLFLVFGFVFSVTLTLIIIKKLSIYFGSMSVIEDYKNKITATNML